LPAKVPSSASLKTFLFLSSMRGIKGEATHEKLVFGDPLQLIHPFQKTGINTGFIIAVPAYLVQSNKKQN
jgi:hypothetical protein